MNLVSPAPAEFKVPPLIVSGPGSAEQLPRVVRRLGIESVAVVTDARLIRDTAGSAIDALRADGLVAGVFSNIEAEPTIDDVEAILAFLSDVRADGLVAIGGGSVIDAAKASAAMARHPGTISDYEGVDRFSRAPLPLIAVPTTAGTGTEVTRVAVITDTSRHVKMLLMADQLIARASVVDPWLTLSCPPPVTASSGMDALSHAIEAYVSRKAQPLTDALALSACAEITASLRLAFADGNDRAARATMMSGQLKAGMAFSNSSVALVHGMSRPLGAVFGIPHGIANAMLLPAVMRFSLAGAPDRYAELASVLGGSRGSGAAASADAVAALSADLGIPSLGGYGLDAVSFKASLGKLAADALASGSPANNPVVPTVEEIIDVYLECF